MTGNAKRKLIFKTYVSLLIYGFNRPLIYLCNLWHYNDDGTQVCNIYLGAKNRPDSGP